MGHPECLASTIDPTAYASNYFDRISADEYNNTYDVERTRILADITALKTVALGYLHPEKGVMSCDPTLFGRNYFERASAEEREMSEEANERAKVLAEAEMLKEVAMGYLLPEVGVKGVDATAFGRGYFSRHGAEEEEEDSAERAQVLAEAMELKKLAVDRMGPEKVVVVSDGTVSGRSYFDRMSAEDEEDVEYAEERAKVLAEAAALKKLAVDYAHPERSVVTSDATICARNYFKRASVTSDEEVWGRTSVLADAAAMKQFAADYMHPERSVTTTDATACARNYYDRNSSGNHPISTVSTRPVTRPQRAMSTTSETFEFDDDVFGEMKEAFRDLEVSIPEKNVSKQTGSESEEEGNLSRSPSCVMLFGMEGESC